LILWSLKGQQLYNEKIGQNADENRSHFLYQFSIALVDSIAFHVLQNSVDEMTANSFGTRPNKKKSANYSPE